MDSKLGVWDLALTAVTNEQMKRSIRKLALDHKRIPRSLKFVTEGVTDLLCAKMCCLDLNRCRPYFVNTQNNSCAGEAKADFK